MHVDVVASHRHYLAHVSPIFDELPGELKGEVFTGWSDKGASRISDARRRHNMILGSSVTDVRRGEGRGILCEHGIGQTYSGSPEGKRNPSYAGGKGRGDVRLFLHPNEHSAKHDRTRYPKAQVEIIGSPYLAELQQIPAPNNPKPVVAVTTHSNVNVCAEAGSAWGAYRAAFGELAKRDDIEVIGTAHPRSFLSLRPHYQSLGIEPVETLEEIVARADCMIFDNTCVSPDTLVLRADDLRWCHARDLRVGDQLIGCDEYHTRPIRNARANRVVQRDDRRLRTVTVTGNRLAQMPCYRVVTTHGSLVVSRTHPWLARGSIPHLFDVTRKSGLVYTQVSTHETWEWRESQNLEVGDEVAFMCDPWTDDRSYEGGWLAGIFDGEGCVHIGKRPIPSSPYSRSRRLNLSVAQNPGIVLDRIEVELRNRKITYSDTQARNNTSVRTECRKISLSGGNLRLLGLLGSIRPERLIRKVIDSQVWDGWGVSNSATRARVLAIEDVGVGDVSVLSTDESTFLAGGFIAHNSAGFLFAGLSRPVVVLDAPWWDRNVNHGLRFWDCADIGPRICASQDTAETARALSTAVDRALSLFPWPGAEERLASIFPPVAEPAKHAATVIAGHMAAL